VRPTLWAKRVLPKRKSFFCGKTFANATHKFSTRNLIERGKNGKQKRALKVVKKIIRFKYMPCFWKIIRKGMRSTLQFQLPVLQPN
jgi:hypothetical protein